MISRIHVRTILTVSAFVILACKPNYSLGTVSEADNITESWVWVSDEPVNINEHDYENKTSLWGKVSRAKSREKAIKDVNWCMHVGVPFERMNFSRFQVNYFCKTF